MDELIDMKQKGYESTGSWFLCVTLPMTLTLEYFKVNFWK